MLAERHFKKLNLVAGFIGGTFFNEYDYLGEVNLSYSYRKEKEERHFEGGRVRLW